LSCDHPGVETYFDGRVAIRSAPGATADALVRSLVSKLTGIDPGLVHHTCPHCGSIEHGRPYVDAAVEISIAHAPGLTVVAVTDSGCVGVDVEVGDDRDWVRTEAVAKAHGTGLVGDRHDEPVRVEEVAVPPGFVAAVALLSREDPEEPG
jgi:phosphopantetheinyl transferase